MKTTFYLFLIFISAISFGQNNYLTPEQVSEFYTSEKKASLGISYPIFRVYEYSDSEGKHHLVLAEQVNNKASKEPSAVQGTHFLIKDGNATKVWSVSDAKMNDNGVSAEVGLWFWTKYFDIKDIDGDGLVDPILIYGSKGMNGYDDGRVNIIVFHKNKKYSIHHQNSTMDGERNTKVDAAYYNLPSSIQSHVKKVMDQLTEKNHAIFPAGWEDAMKSKKTAFDEN
ncbi:MAG: hypothetical protein R2799_03930 [Crocinitomicaceae bacterium]